MKQKFNVTGMTCSACSSRVEKEVSKLTGVNISTVNLLTNSMVCDYDETVTSSDLIINAITTIGYGASVVTDSTTKGKSSTTNTTDSADEMKHTKHRVIFSFVFLIPLMYVSMGEMMGLPIPTFLSGHKNAVSFAFTQFLLTLPIVYLNMHYYKNGLRALIKRTPNMDSLVAIGSLSALLYGIFAIYRISYGLATSNMELVSTYHMDLYFESAGTILTLISFGKFLEAKSKKKTSESLRKLMDLSPKTAFVERNGIVSELDIHEVITGDIVHVKPGSSIPCDGIILEGFTYVDESVITGESNLVEKEVGTNVIGATINQNGFIKIQATKVGDDSVFSQIIKLVEEASATKAPIAKLADKIAGIFVPTVMIIAVAVAAIWLLLGYNFEFALSMGITVLVISCPCALGLATPVAIMVGTGKGAELGILIKSGDALEHAHKIQTIILDKTGTITEGKPKVIDIIPLHISQEMLLKIAYSLELKSEHPLGAAIIEYAKAEQYTSYDITDFHSISGMGITAIIEGATYTIGNKRLFMQEDISLDAATSIMETVALEGKIPLFIAKNKEYIGTITVADKIKEHSKEAILNLKKMGIEVIMLTGDNEATAQHIGTDLSLDQIIAEVLPSDKESIVRQFQEQGKIVGMVGDGINDAPALVSADVGIAIGAGTDIAIDSADIILMRSDLQSLVTAIELSRSVMRNIKQNLFWAFFYNILGIPLAAGALYIPFGLKLTPMFGSFAMSFSSLFVVTNALRLKLFKQKGVVETINHIQEKELETMELNINGMMCGHCVAHVEKALKAVPGVTEVVVSLDTNSATVTGDTLDRAILEQAVVDAGYEIRN